MVNLTHQVACAVAEIGKRYKALTSHTTVGGRSVAAMCPSFEGVELLKGCVALIVNCKNGPGTVAAMRYELRRIKALGWFSPNLKYYETLCTILNYIENESTNFLSRQ